MKILFCEWSTSHAHSPNIAKYLRREDENQQHTYKSIGITTTDILYKDDKLYTPVNSFEAWIKANELSLNDFKGFDVIAFINDSAWPHLQYSPHFIENIEAINDSEKNTCLVFMGMSHLDDIDRNQQMQLFKDRYFYYEIKKLNVESFDIRIVLKKVEFFWLNLLLDIEKTHD
ncbi:MAG: hypothetical protein QNJ45_23955 [Ardenticatenaceae bacterium]|nr:hypothetical protein [Ardenticatenaceae bacterium]